MSRDDENASEDKPHKRRKLSHDVSHPTGAQRDRTASSKDDVRSHGNGDGEVVISHHSENADEAIPGIEDHQPANESSSDASSTAGVDLQEEPILSKNQQKKLLKRAAWEAGRADRKTKRKEKVREKRVRKKAGKAEEAAVLSKQNNASKAATQLKSRSFVRLPVAFLIDCSFDSLMADKERISLASQITRCYSDNHHAPCQAHMSISSWGGLLKERFDTVLEGHYRNWKDVHFLETGILDAATHAAGTMRRKDGGGGSMTGAFAQHQPALDHDNDGNDAGEVIYLTADSPHTLTHLLPYHTYIIGGLVDKNRHKGICYKTATEQNIKTAKLPIAEYMEMQSRAVLAVNHVFEIMLRWLQGGDWGEAFLRVVPRRKGGRLKGRGGEREMERERGRRDNGEVRVKTEDEDEDEDEADPERANGDGGNLLGGEDALRSEHDPDPISQC